MIREFVGEDRKQLIDIVKQGIMIDMEDINFITDNCNKIIVFDDSKDGILGFSTFRIWGKDNNKAYIYLCSSELKKKRNWNFVIS